MSGAESTARPRQAPPPGLIVSLIALPFRIFGVLCGSLLLSILIECVGMHVFWEEQGWHHAEGMLYFEVGQLSDYFKKSVVVQEPGRTTQRLIERTYDTLLIDSGALKWLETQSLRAKATQRAGPARVRSLLSGFYARLHDYALAAFYTLLTFLVRLMVLLLTAPLFVLAAAVGIVDGLVRRDIRRFGAGRESGFIYHRARASIVPLIVLPWVVYLALPVSVHPLWILTPGAMLLCLAVNLAAGSFKKYL